jgi:hypothetical protein
MEGTLALLCIICNCIICNQFALSAEFTTSKKLLAQRYSLTYDYCDWGLVTSAGFPIHLFRCLFRERRQTLLGSNLRANGVCCALASGNHRRSAVRIGNGLAILAAPEAVGGPVAGS